MIDRLLKTHLEPIARDYRRWQLWRALAWCWAALTIVGVGFLLVRQVTGWSFPFVFPLLVLAAIVAALILWRRHSRDRFDYCEIARQIEEQDPRLHALLLTAIEQQPDRATGELTYLQQRVIGEALGYRHKHLWGQHASVRLFYAQCAHLTTLALLVAVLSGLYVTLPAGQSFFAAQSKAKGVTVTPGDASVERGSSLVVLVRFDGKVPAEATLVIRPANQNEQRVALTKNLDDPVFGTSIPEINNELTYRIEYGAQETRDFKVSVFEFPRLERADAKLTFPEYTALPEKTIEDTRRVSAVEGTALDYTFHLNKPVRSATLVAKDNSTISLLADTNRPNVYQTGLKLDRSQRYDLVLVDDADRTNKVPPQFVIDVLKNRSPELKFAFPRGDQRVSALEEIAFQAEVSDDFGLRAYGLAYNLAGEETKFVELGQSTTPQEKRQLRHLLPLEDLDAHPDQLLSYYIWADDVAPDGQVRRTSSDMFFAEVRPFEEIFREGQSPEGGAGAAGAAQGNQSEKLAELQKQIINATWKLRRQETGSPPSAQYKKDAPVVQEAQENALDQVSEMKEEIDDPRSRALVETVETEMKKAVQHLTEAVDKNSVGPLPPALSAEQSAYQALLRLASREYQVSRGRNQQGGGGGGQRAQRQLDQLELKQTENRYETQRQASPQQNPEQREQMQVFNRLKELAQRQQDLNERLKELQTALQEAKTEQEREEIQRRLKRLREEQQEMLADMDELNQRMSSPENQSRMAEARQQLEQTRSEVQRAAESMENGQVSQALSSGTRAQRDLQQLRDDFRKKNSSQFADDMRELRDDARELAQKQEEIGQKLESLNDSKRKTLTDSEERKELASQLDEQKKRMDEVIDHATQVTQQAEPVEPLLSKQLYDTLRKATQDEARNLQETTEDLLQQGRLYRAVYEKLQEAKGGAKKSVEVTADLLREGFAPEANQLEQRARKSINDLKSGVERAAESVLGDDTEALRLAKRELEALSQQLEKELARAEAEQGQAAAGTPTQRGSRDGLQRAGERADEQTNEPTPTEGRDGENPSSRQAASTQGEQPGQPGGRSATQNQQGARAANGGSPEGQPQAQDQAQDSQSPGGAQASQGQAGNSQQQSRSANSQQSGNGGPSEAASNDGQAQRGQRNASGGRRNFFDGGGNDGGGTGGWEGPILGAEYTQWSDRLRDVEEMLDEPELRTQAARIRDRARAMRVESKRHSEEPKWDLVKLEIAAPLAELRSRVAEALARRESNEAIVPIDRDPVPTRYSELVRRYYEQLGKSESGTPADPGGPK
ncbi:MAG TPA: hypothetical protein VJW76_08645 [Verrucomicrobiae bacterium]|nr:hypothetical protein [Verrucomicrobiae bacterium]